MESSDNPLDAVKFKEHRHRILGLIHAPCPQLCAHKWTKPMTTFHATCLTCQDRRLEFQKFGWESLKRVKHVRFDMEIVNPRGVIMPRKYYAYGIIINMEHGFFGIKAVIVKLLATLAERIAEL